MISQRFIMVFLCAACVCINYADRVNMSVAIISIAEDYNYSIEQQGIIMSSFFLGYIPMQIGGAVLCRRFGGKAVLSYGALLWSFFTIVTPLACQFGYTILLLCRVCMGLAEGVAFPSVYHFLSTWVPASERSRSVSILLTGVHVGTTVALIVSPIIIRDYSWQFVFYSFGSVGVLWILVWTLVAYDKEDKQSTVGGGASAKETGDSGNQGETIEREELLESNERDVDFESQHVANSDQLGGTFGQVLSDTERKAILFIAKSKSCMAVCTTQTLFGLIHYTILSWLPSYFRYVFGTETTSLSFTFVPYLCMAVSANIGGFLADALLKRGFALTRVRKIMTVVANVGAGVMLVVFSRADSVAWAVGSISLSLALMSLNCGGFESSYLDMASPGLSGIFKAVANTLGSFAGLIAIPFSTVVLRALGGSWRLMFGSLSVWFGLIVGVFNAWGSADRILTEGAIERK